MTAAGRRRTAATRRRTAVPCGRWWECASWRPVRHWPTRQDLAHPSAVPWLPLHLGAALRWRGALQAHGQFQAQCCTQLQQLVDRNGGGVQFHCGDALLAQVQPRTHRCLAQLAGLAGGLKHAPKLDGGKQRLWHWRFTPIASNLNLLLLRVNGKYSQTE